MAQRRYIPHRTKKERPTGTQASNPSDFDICDSIRGIVDIIAADFVDEVLEANYTENVSTNRSAFIKEVYRVLSI